MLNKLAEHWVNGLKILFLKHEHPKSSVKKMTNTGLTIKTTMRSHIYPISLSILQLLRCEAPEF